MTVWRIIYILAFLIAPTSAILGADANQPKSDIRVLVDISGSMKQNDPQNLRVPAIQLFSQLLPENSRAGVWAFGEYVNMTVPLDDVSKAWKQMAMRTTREIDSTGLYTNLGSAIERATFGWTKADPNSKRSLIILTDGMVDVSPNQEVNDRARRKILRETLPELRAAGVVIHTIALAGDADESLMAQLSAQTDGWYQKIAVADQLQEAFLKIFGQATDQDSIPLDNNSFLVDDQITEFTLVLFKTGAAKPVQLEKPDGERFDASKDTAEVSWYEGTDYDLITVTKPMVGNWRVEAEV
ncbi:MAG: VWA domain-containing protein, partial [Gammaproteobacteria bacterium]|nr:VWA domain-containing protein [Gammaproteobacteria bacterium]